MDSTVIPIRGQTVIVKNNPGFMCAVARDFSEQDELCYSMTRSNGMLPIYSHSNPKFCYIAPK